MSDDGRLQFDLDPLDLQSLNPDQLDAVVHRGGPLLVVAGAGSGKTRVLTHRIAHLIHEGVPPTSHPGHHVHQQGRRRDEAPRRRAGRAGGEGDVGVHVPLGVRAHPARQRRCARLPAHFSIYDQADAQRLAGYVVRDLGLDAKRFPPRGRARPDQPVEERAHHPARWRVERAANIFERKHADIYADYQARLLKAGAMDFDDLLMNTVMLFRQHPDVLAHYQQRFKHVLIDEYQDTNTAQNEIALQLAAGHEQITIVGDGDQCLPPGTMIRTLDGEVPIEQIHVGDVVLGSQQTSPRSRRATVRRVHVGRYLG